ncbi:MAG TPA: hypothetical protein VFO31_23065 [Vicinamibacterales bacterium]|nr:hypothetical protein [Vicinamibacterales bacterium]
MTFGLAAWTGVSRATELEKLLMPGDLARAHASIESECSLCHDRTDKPRQRQLCLGCHDHSDVASDIAAGKGLHGRVAKTAQCNACHTEHKGRGADTVKLVPEAFDHSRTDFKLDGAHVGVRCAACHATGKKYRQAPLDCAGCHKDDDVHQGKLGKDCAQCHDTTQFKTTRFDHSTTKFPLRGAHATAACVSCHRDPGFKGAPGRCVDCHAGDDVHRGANGPDCASCHGSDDWKRTRFDHVKASGYALLGKHASLACDSCHRGGDLKAPLPRECTGCHASTDVHAGRFGTACADCHAQDDWKVANFDHEKRAKYALRGAHATLDCHACHTGVLKQQQVAKECAGCHAVDDVHKGSLGRDCQLCHKESAWRDEVKFDHDLTRFPLVGLHVGVPCEECHATRAFREAPHECVSCHRAKDVHAAKLGEECGSCHNANGWSFWQFDHATQTKFPLTGAHERLGCRDCHRDAEHKSTTAGACVSCHQADDVHEGQFGRDCGRCHGTKAFRQLLTH